MHRLFALLLLSATVACAHPAAKPAQPLAPAPSHVPQPIDLTNPPQDRSDVERIYRVAPSDHAPELGPKSAKVDIEVCSDFECPFCAQLAPTVHELAENYGELVHIAWRNCPLPFHHHALPAAEAAVEVYQQGGNAAFWAYHDQLFSHQDALDDEALVRYAEGIAGVDKAKLSVALHEHRHIGDVQQDLKAIVESGAASGGFGTPATCVNGRLISGAQPYQVFEDAVERALKETPEQRNAAQAASDAAYPMVRLRHILIQYQGARGAEKNVTRSKDEARALASELHDRIVTQGASMAELAKQKSDCPSAPDGGELGRFTKGELLPEIENVAFALKPGEVSPVVESPYGFHVILREE